MKKEDLIQQFPWINIPLLFEESPDISLKFTPDQWREISESGVPEALNRSILNPLLLTQLLDNLYDNSTNPMMARFIASGEISLKELSAIALKTTLQLKLTAEKLIPIFPWIAHRLVSVYAPQFTLNQWAHMHCAGMPDFLSSGMLNDLLIAGLFEAISLVAANPQVAENIQSGDYSFPQIVKNQLEIFKQVAQQQSLVNPTTVIDWFGPELIRLLEHQIKSYTDVDNLFQILSSNHIRALLAGDQSVIATLPFKPPALVKLQGKDVRTLLINKEMNFSIFLDLATELYKALAQPMDKELPDWVKDSLELQKLANEFSDMQLSVLGRSLDVSILRECELKCNFLRSLVLAGSASASQKKLTDMTDPETFEQWILSQQAQFLRFTQKYAVPLAENLTKTFNSADIPALSASKEEPSTNFLIKKYVPDYRKNPLTPIPTDPKRRQQLLECALRNIALNG